MAVPARCLLGLSLVDAQGKRRAPGAALLAVDQALHVLALFAVALLAAA